MENALSLNDQSDDNGSMATIERNAIPPNLLDDFDAALRDAMNGVSDPAAMRQAAEEQDRLREELRQRVGELNVAVELLREVRDEA